MLQHGKTYVFVDIEKCVTLKSMTTWGIGANMSAIGTLVLSSSMLSSAACNIAAGFSFNENAPSKTQSEIRYAQT